MKYEIQYRINELLNTIEEALEYINNVIEEKKYANVEYLLDDIQDAVESIENAIIENYFDAEIQNETQSFLRELKLLKTALENNKKINILRNNKIYIVKKFNQWKKKIKNEIKTNNIS